MPVLKTFRDPAGELALRDDAAYRTVRRLYRSDVMEFVSSSLAAALVQQGRLIDSFVMATEPDLQLRHRRIGFVSYPWEWPPSMWVSAAKLTLELCADLLKEGWILKDATPLNILFEGTKPLFVDLLSVERANFKDPLWYAHGQFVRTFLLPLMAYKHLGWPLQATMARRDGYEPEEIASALTWTKRFQQPMLSTVTLPLLFSSGRPGVAAAQKAAAVDPELGKYVLGKTIARALRRLQSVGSRSKGSAWSDYTDTAVHYSPGEAHTKWNFVQRVLTVVRPKKVLDVGCNAGVYSRLAADCGAEVVAIDTDLQTVDGMYKRIADSSHAASILPLCVDLSRPTPALGWENSETESFLSRCEGRFDTVLMLAVIHHLLLSSQIPLDHIAKLCQRLTTNCLVIEWVPPTDVKFQEILRGRGAIYQHLTEAAFRRAFGEAFTIVEEETLTNGRILFDMRRRNL